LKAQQGWSYNAEYTSAKGYHVRTIEEALRSLRILDIESDEATDDLIARAERRNKTRTSS
jgi:hypothetical protein